MVSFRCRWCHLGAGSVDNTPGVSLKGVDLGGRAILLLLAAALDALPRRHHVSRSNILHVSHDQHVRKG